MAVNNAGVVERVPCPGRKIWEFAVNSNKVIVKHYGEHTCTSKEVMPFTAEEEFRKRPSTKLCELRRDILGDMIRSGATMNDVEDIANEYLERFWETLTSRDLQSLKKNTKKTISFSFIVSTPRKVMEMTHMCLNQVKRASTL